MRVCSLFSGIGGIDLAFEQAGEVNVEDIPFHDVLTAGFPCQPFSMAQNNKRGLEHKSGLTFKNNKLIFNEILNSLKDLGYEVNWKVLNAKDFGVPQNRERVFIIGNLLKVGFVFPEPNKPTGLKVVDILEKEGEGSGVSLFTETRKRGEVKVSEDNICPTLRAENLIPTLTANMGTGGHNIPYVILPEDKLREQDTGMIFAGYLNKEIRKNGVSPNTEHLSRVHKQPNRIYSVDVNRQGYRVYDPNNISVAVLADRGGIFSNTEGYLINGRPRKLTLRECARLQGFPDSFKLVCSNSQSYKQLGNSVCVPLIKELALSILEYLKYNYIMSESQCNKCGKIISSGRTVIGQKDPNDADYGRGGGKSMFNHYCLRCQHSKPTENKSPQEVVENKPVEKPIENTKPVENENKEVDEIKNEEPNKSEVAEEKKVESVSEKNETDNKEESES
ncbi:10362_t:CDS:2 [Funneliformis geosporum]|nr:10362_t:CDS:2 [Funneliformis geosporum]